MALAHGSTGDASYSTPTKPSGGGPHRPPAPAPAHSSPPRSYSSGSSAPPRDYSYDYSQHKAPAAPKVSLTPLQVHHVDAIRDTIQGTGNFLTDSIGKMFDGPDYTYSPGAVAKAEDVLQLAKGQADGTPLPLVNSMGVRVTNPAEAAAPKTGVSLEDAKAKLEALQRVRRERAVQGKHADVDAMTAEEYYALTDRERAAVDFNTMLVRGVRRDKKMQDEYDPTDREQKKYDHLVEKMFGEGGDSEKYAPETLAVLNQIGYHDQAADLDDFLSLRAAITSKDINRMGPTIGPSTFEGTANEVQLDRIEMTEDLAARTARLEDTLVKGQKLLATVSQTSIVDRNPLVEDLGGVAKDPNVMFGFGTFKEGTPEADIDSYFRSAFEKLAREPGDTDAKLKQLGEDFGIIGTNLGDPSMGQELYNQFIAYSDARTRNADRYNFDLGETKGVKYHTPEEYRKLLLLDNNGPDPTPSMAFDPRRQAQEPATPPGRRPRLPETKLIGEPMQNGGY